MKPLQTPVSRQRDLRIAPPHPHGIPAGSQGTQGMSPATNGAPPVYRPNGTAMAKMGGAGIGGAPPVYRPHAMAQPKAAVRVMGVQGMGVQGMGGAPPVYRPNTTSAHATVGRGTAPTAAARDLRTGGPAQHVLQARINPLPPPTIASGRPAQVVPSAAAGRPSRTIQRVVDFTKRPWLGPADWGLDTVQWPKKEELLEAIAAVEAAPDGLETVMANYDRTALEQLKHCVTLSEGKDAGALATCLYTSYFYVPVNSYLRNRHALDGVNPSIKTLVEKTIEMMKDKAVEHTVLTSRRVENKSEWMHTGLPIGTKLGVGHVLNFSAFTSLSRDDNKDALAAMKEANKTNIFGDVTTPALLKFSGTTRMVTPESKYFENEEEYIALPGMRARVTAVKNATTRVMDASGKPKMTWVPQSSGFYKKKSVREPYIVGGAPVLKYKLAIL